VPYLCLPSMITKFDGRPLDRGFILSEMVSDFAMLYLRNVARLSLGNY